MFLSQKSPQSFENSVGFCAFCFSLADEAELIEWVRVQCGMSAMLRGIFAIFLRAMLTMNTKSTDGNCASSIPLNASVPNLNCDNATS
jgi:hypothetical protein